MKVNLFENFNPNVGLLPRHRRMLKLIDKYENLKSALEFVDRDDLPIFVEAVKLLNVDDDIVDLIQKYEVKIQDTPDIRWTDIHELMDELDELFSNSEGHKKAKNLLNRESQQ